MSRYPVHLLCEPHKDDFICSICHDVLDKPMETPCRHVFCRQCIRAVCMAQSKNATLARCPLCRELVLVHELKPALPVFKNILNQLKIKCKFTECRYAMPLERYLSHIEECEFKLVECPFANCAMKGQQKDLNAHKLECVFRNIQCPMGCGKMIVYNDTQDHIDYQCTKGFKKCRRCKVPNIDSSHDCVTYLLSALAEKEQKNQSLQQQVTQLTQENGLRLFEDLRIGGRERELEEEVLRLRQQITSVSGMVQHYQMMEQEVHTLRQENMNQRYEMEVLKFQESNVEQLKKEAEMFREEVELLRQENGMLKRRQESYKN